jgi:hypothetical protein
MPEAVKFHDDKGLYTGVYKNGGPTNVDKVKPSQQRIFGRKLMQLHAWPRVRGCPRVSQREGPASAPFPSSQLSQTPALRRGPAPAVHSAVKCMYHYAGATRELGSRARNVLLHVNRCQRRWRSDLGSELRLTAVPPPLCRSRATSWLRARCTSCWTAAPRTCAA